MKTIWLAVPSNVSTRTDLQSIIDQYPALDIRLTHVDSGYWWTPTDTPDATRSRFIDLANIDTDQIIFPTQFRDEFMETSLYAWTSQAGTQERNISRSFLQAHYGGSIGADPELNDNLVVNINLGPSWTTLSDSRILSSTKREVLQSLRLVIDKIRGTRPDIPDLGFNGFWGYGGRNANSTEYAGAEDTALWVLDTVVNPLNPSHGSISAGAIDDTPLFGEYAFYAGNRTWLDVFNTIGQNLTFTHQNFKPFGNNSEHATAWFAANLRPDTRMINNDDPVVLNNTNNGSLGGIEFWKGATNQKGRLAKGLNNQNQYNPINLNVASTPLSVVGILEPTYRSNLLATNDPGANIPVSVDYLKEQVDYLNSNANFDAICILITSGKLDNQIGTSGVTYRDQLTGLFSYLQDQASPPPPANPGTVISFEMNQDAAVDKLSVTYFKSKEFTDSVSAFTYGGNGEPPRPIITDRISSVCFPDIYYDKFGLDHGVDLETSPYASIDGTNATLPNCQVLTTTQYVALIFIDSLDNKILQSLGLLVGGTNQQLRVEEDFFVQNTTGGLINLRGLYNVANILNTDIGTRREVTLACAPAVPGEIGLGASEQRPLLTWEELHPNYPPVYQLVPAGSVYNYTLNVFDELSSMKNTVTADNVSGKLITGIPSSSVQRLRITGSGNTTPPNQYSLFFENAFINGDPRENFEVGDKIQIDNENEYQILDHYLGLEPDLDVSFGVTQI